MVSQSEQGHSAVPQRQERQPQRRISRRELLRAMTLVTIVAAAVSLVACEETGSPASIVTPTAAPAAAQVFGLHPVEFKPGVSEADLTKAVTQMNENMALPGWHIVLLKADRGENEGKYLVIYEVDTVAQRDHFFPPPSGHVTDEGQKLLDAHPDLLEPLMASSTFLGDYIVLAR